MKNISLNLSGKVDEPVLRVCERISLCASSLTIPFFVVGATARDMILTLGYEVPIQRATADIDFGIRIPAWKQFASLKQSLLSSGDFKEVKNVEQRLMYDRLFSVDIIPFGSLADKNGVITWPPRNENAMSVQGFQEAYENKVLIRLRAEPVLDIPVANLAGLAMLKLVSWNDDHIKRRRDAEDILLIIQNYLGAGNQRRLSDANADILEEEGFDIERAGARLLGRDISEMASSGTKSTLLSLLNLEIDKADESRLVLDMIQGGPVFDDGRRFQRALKFLADLRLGIKE